MTMTLAPSTDYSAPAPYDVVLKTADAVRARGIKVEVVQDASAAHDKLLALIPKGATIMTGASKTLQEIGFEERLIAKNHAWVNLKDEVLLESDPVKQGELRKKSILSPYFIGSVQAVTQSGEVVIASASGSQLAPYAYSSQNIIWVAGAQKIVPTLQDALDRIHNHSLPSENVRMQALYGKDSVVAKILIVAHEPAMMGRNVNLILVNQPVGV